MKALLLPSQVFSLPNPFHPRRLFLSSSTMCFAISRFSCLHVPTSTTSTFVPPLPTSPFLACPTSLSSSSSFSFFFFSTCNQHVKMRFSHCASCVARFSSRFLTERQCGPRYFREEEEDRKESGGHAKGNYDDRCRHEWRNLLGDHL